VQKNRGLSLIIESPLFLVKVCGDYAVNNTGHGAVFLISNLLKCL
jgi:hypothetical protein